MSDPDSVCWSNFTSYFELDRAAANARIKTSNDFVRGPFAQFLHLAVDPSESRGVRARTMQFAKRRFSYFRTGLTPPEAVELDRLVECCLEELRMNSIDAWLIDVWDGRVGHHGV